MKRRKREFSLVLLLSNSHSNGSREVSCGTTSRSLVIRCRSRPSKRRSPQFARCRKRQIGKPGDQSSDPFNRCIRDKIIQIIKSDSISYLLNCQLQQFNEINCFFSKKVVTGVEWYSFFVQKSWRAVFVGIQMSVFRCVFDV